MPKNSKDTPLRRTESSTTICEASISPDSETASSDPDIEIERDGRCSDLPQDCCDLDEYDAHVTTFAQHMSCAAFLFTTTAFLLHLIVYDEVASFVPITLFVIGAAFVLAGRAAFEHDFFVHSTRYVYGTRSERDLLSFTAARLQQSVIATLCIATGTFLWMTFKEVSFPVWAALAVCPFFACGISLLVNTAVISRLYDHESFNERQEQRFPAVDDTSRDEEPSSVEARAESSLLRRNVPRIAKALLIAAACSTVMWVTGQFLGSTHVLSLMIAGDVMCHLVFLPFAYPCAVIALA